MPLPDEVQQEESATAAHLAGSGEEGSESLPLRQAEPQEGRSSENLAQEEVKKPKRLVSFDVFMKYVVLREDRVDISKVFSKACFEEWIENRKRTPKEPEESFRKALVAHVSGKDDRKPFTPEVEFEILKRLRESQPWPCFADSMNGANKIGERGLKKSSLGYHEGKRKRDEFAPAVPGGSRGFPTVAPHPGNKYAAQYHQYYAVPPPQMHVSTGIFPGYYPPPPQAIYQPPGYYLPPPAKRPNTLPVLNNGTMVLEKGRKNLSLAASRVDFCFEQKRESTFSGLLANTLTQFYSGIELKKLFGILPDLLNAEVAKKLNNESNAKSRELFIFPQGTKFDEKKQVGQLVLDVCGQVLSGDKIAEGLLPQAFKGSLFALFRDPLERALSLTYTLESLLSSGSTLARWVILQQGKTQVFLVFLELTRERTLLCKIQDISESYHHRGQ